MIYSFLKELRFDFNTENAGENMSFIYKIKFVLV